jgi:hypothetical protein
MAPTITLSLDRLDRLNPTERLGLALDLIELADRLLDPPPATPEADRLLRDLGLNPGEATPAAHQ